MKTVLMTLSTIIILSLLGGLTVMYAGLFNVATAWEDPALVRWVLNTTREKAVARRAASIEVPSLGDEKQVEEGFRSYREMCAICHTPPGADASPTAQGLNPEPPDLSKHVEHMSEAELFWVIKNGVRMTGMPAWGPTHDDTELWNVVAFVKALPTMGGAGYRALDQQAEKGHSHSGGGHGDETQMGAEREAGHDNEPHEEAEHQDDGHAH